MLPLALNDTTYAVPVPLAWRPRLVLPRLPSQPDV